MAALLKLCSGVLKQRYSDFIVNEIDSSGVVAHLTSEALPATPSDPPPEPAAVCLSFETPVTVDRTAMLARTCCVRSCWH